MVAAAVCAVAIGTFFAFAFYWKTLNKVSLFPHSRLPAGFHDCSISDCQKMYLEATSTNQL